MEFLQLTAKQAAIAIENSILYESIDRFVPKMLLKSLGCNNLPELKLGDNKLISLSIIISDFPSFASISKKLSSSKIFIN